MLLDEAHCAKPFLQTLQAVGRFREWASEPLGRPFYPVVMSATPPLQLSDVFADNSKESRDPDHILGKRHLAHKYAKMRTIAKAPTDEMPHALADVAADLLTGSPRAIVVFTNRIATARKAFHLLNERQIAKTVLLTGRMRQIDRDHISSQLANLESGPLSYRRNLKKSVIVVATQTLEVGADLDFDDLVTECASLDSLRQRFGRLNRAGRPIKSRAEILVRKDQIKKDDNDPIYGTSLAKTWNWLDQIKDGEGHG